MNRSLKRIVLDTKDVMTEPIDNIFYYAEEANMYKGYALIIGPNGTPYEKGFYFFEFNFTDSYPFSPPKVKFHNYDGFTRFNPNLYINGYVCLSILNTWEGEKWSSCQSIRSVLLTLSTILNDSPLLNEPGFTPDHPCLKDYNEIIEFKNIEISVLKYLEKTNLPYPFHYFYPTITKHFIDNYSYFHNKIKDKPARNAVLTIYNNMSCYMDYKHLLQLLELNYNDLKN
jgi:ubiquitin-conjugating enzyme E2 Z